MLGFPSCWGGVNWFPVKAEREFPEEFEARETDKLHYRYPEGERWENGRAGVQKLRRENKANFTSFLRCVRGCFCWLKFGPAFPLRAV